MPTITTSAEREELARRLHEQHCGVPESNGQAKPNYIAGGVARAYLAARRISVVEYPDGFTIQVEVHGDILPWVHGVPDGATIRAVTQHGRTQWQAYDEAGACVGHVFHGVGNMWQWRFHDT